MACNLIEDPWLPVRRRSGERAWARPCELGTAEDPVVALDFPRADWNAAVTEWLIGVLYLALGTGDDGRWAELFDAPPTVGRLQQALAPLAFAFGLADPAGPLAFQDRELADARTRPVSALLIDAPGESTVRRNADLFVKRDGPQRLCPSYAAAALITMMAYAPAGGAGHRTSVRGGGPLTTLLAPGPGASGDAIESPLWDILWANVPAEDGAAEARNPERIFPWLAPTRTSAAHQAVHPEDASPAQAFFGCPRRIRLLFETGVCDWSGLSGPVATAFVMQPHGPNYVGWIHPLSPYRPDAAGRPTALHPHLEGFDATAFADWWGVDDGVPARAVALWQDRRDRLATPRPAPGIRVYGFDMDNMKARQWLERDIPWYPLYGSGQERRRREVRRLTLSLAAASRTLLHAGRLAVLGRRSDHGYRLDGLPRTALQDTAEALRSRLEPAFRQTLEALLAGPDEPLGAADGDGPWSVWLDRVRREVVAGFEEMHDPVSAAFGDVRRQAVARALLDAALAPGGAVQRALKTPA